MGFYCFRKLESMHLISTGDDLAMTEHMLSCHETKPVNWNQERDITHWMPGLEPGDLVACEMIPIAYKA